ncbi:MAG: hypothetical protein ABS36_10325 [Acidobacteria bacterium SCN 69-37]|nr:MAG: hypothetical protein ABS36_10325 [Acidobacteria bacterium SCN 69-37]
MAQTIDDGTKVRLKSGGPTMTVVDFGQYGYGSRESYKCRWFDDKHKLTEATFTEAELEVVPPNGSMSIKLERA